MDRIINGDIFIDDRGKLLFVNKFDFSTVKRFYTVSNHKKGFIRAWHGHRHEEKFVFVPSGTALIGIVPLEDLTVNSCEKFILSSSKPRILHIPAGYANGFQNLEDNTIIQFFSTVAMEDAVNDDIRFNYDIVNIWEDNYR